MTPLAVSTFFQAVLATMLVAPVVILWVIAVIDVFRHGFSGVKIAAMLVLILVFPVIGPLCYFVFARPEDTSTEAVEATRLAREDMRREAARRPIPGA